MICILYQIQRLLGGDTAAAVADDGGTNGLPWERRPHTINKLDSTEGEFTFQFTFSPQEILVREHD